MKQVFKKQLFAVILMIAMVLGIFPLSQAMKVEAASTPVITLLYSSDFSGDVDAHLSSIRTCFNGSVTTAVNVSKTGFTTAWNNMGYNQEVVIVDTHGTPTSLTNGYSTNYVSTSDISKLNYKNIKCIILLGCNCGHYDYKNRNIAMAFARRFNCTVVASDGTDILTRTKDKNGKVTKVTNLPKNDKEWKDWTKAAGGNQNRLHYGWIVYRPDSYYYGQMYIVGRYSCTVGDLYKKSKTGSISEYIKK